MKEFIDLGNILQRASEITLVERNGCCVRVFLRPNGDRIVSPFHEFNHSTALDAVARYQDIKSELK